MTRYLISFGAHAMEHIPGGDAPAVARAAHAVVREAVSDGPYPQAVGGFTLIDVPSRGEALMVSVNHILVGLLKQRVAGSPRATSG